MYRGPLSTSLLGISLSGCFLFGGSTNPSSPPPAEQPLRRSPEFDRTLEEFRAAIAEATEGYEEIASADGQLEGYAPATLDAKRGECHVVVIELLEGAQWSDHAMQSLTGRGTRPGEDYQINHGNIAYGPGVVFDNGCVQADGQVVMDVVATVGSATDQSRLHELGTGPIKSTLYLKTLPEDEIAAIEQERAAQWEQAAIEAEQYEREQRARERQAEADRQARLAQQDAAPPPRGSSASPSPSSGPSVVSVQLKNECPETVKLFFGTKPKFGSGRYSSLSSNTRTSQSMKPGDMIWIVDDSQNGISSATVSGSTREIVVDRSCAGLRAR